MFILKHHWCIIEFSVQTNTLNYINMNQNLGHMACHVKINKVGKEYYVSRRNHIITAYLWLSFSLLDALYQLTFNLLLAIFGPLFGLSSVWVLMRKSLAWVRWNITGHKMTASAMGQIVCLFICLFVSSFIIPRHIAYHWRGRQQNERLFNRGSVCPWSLTGNKAYMITANQISLY